MKCPQKAITLDNQDVLDEFINSFKNTDEITSFRTFVGKKKIGLPDILRIPGNMKKWGLS